MRLNKAILAVQAVSVFATPALEARWCEFASRALYVSDVLLTLSKVLVTLSPMNLALLLDIVETPTVSFTTSLT